MLGGNTSVRILVDAEVDGQCYVRWLPHGFDARVVDHTSLDQVTAELVIIDSDSAVEVEINAQCVLRMETAPDDTTPETGHDRGEITLEKPVGAGSFLAAVERFARREWYARRLSEYARDVTGKQAATPAVREPVAEVQESEALDAVVTGFDGADFRAAFHHISESPVGSEQLNSTEG